MRAKPSTPPDYTELAQLWVNIAEYMDEGHSFDELYDYAISMSKSAPLKQVWDDMRTSTGSPLDVMALRNDVIPKWFYQIFFSGMTTGIPTMWAYGGNAYMDAQEMDRAKAFKKLVQAVVDCGMDPEEAPAAVEEILGATSS